MTAPQQGSWIRPDWSPELLHRLGRRLAGSGTLDRQRTWTAAGLLQRAGHPVARTLDANLRHADPELRRSTARECLRRHLLTVLQFWRLERVATDDIRAATALSGEEPFPRGATGACIFVGSHSGNWDYAQVALRDRYGPLLLVAGRPPTAKLRELVLSSYRTHGLDVAFLGEPAARFDALVTWVAARRSVLLMNDFTPERNGRLLPFLDGEAVLPTGAARLALRTGATVVPFGCWFEQVPDRVAVRTGRPVELRRGSGSLRSELEVMSDVLSAISGHIEEHPEDWHLVADIVEWRTPVEHRT